MRKSNLAAAGCFAIAIVTVVSTGTASAQFSNPIVNQSHLGGHHYDPFTDHHTISNHTETVRESALDPYRNHIDPGSYRYVDRYTYDQYGRRVREYGYQWTSYGRPHGKLTRVRVDHYPGSNTWWPSGPSVTGISTHVEHRSRHRPSVSVQNSESVNYSGLRPPRRPSMTVQNSQSVNYSNFSGVPSRPRPSVTQQNSQSVYHMSRP